MNIENCDPYNALANGADPKTVWEGVGEQGLAAGLSIVLLSYSYLAFIGELGFMTFIAPWMLGACFFVVTIVYACASDGSDCVTFVMDKIGDLVKQLFGGVWSWIKSLF